MTSKTKYSLKTKDRDTYLDLVTAFPLVSIRSDDHLEVAGQVMDRILAKGKLDQGEELYLDALSDLVEAYEYNHETIEPASDADMLRHLMEAKLSKFQVWVGANRDRCLVNCWGRLLSHG